MFWVQILYNKIEFMGHCTDSILKLFCIQFLLTIITSVGPDNLCSQIISAYHQKNAAETERLSEQLNTSNHTKCAIYLEPIYEWAQNMTHLIIKFQFINSGRTSACSHVLWRKRQAQHSNINVQVGCIQSEHILIYETQITTFMPINPYFASWHEGEQNSFVLQCPKSPSPYFWKRLKLHPKQGEKSKIWWKMLQKYKQNLKNFLGDLQIDEKQVVLSKGRKGKYTKTHFSKRSKAQSKYFYCGDNSPFELGSWLTQ